jgi:hypothetical protein
VFLLHGRVVVLHLERSSEGVVHLYRFITTCFVVRLATALGYMGKIILAG